MPSPIPFQNSYIFLPGHFFSRQTPRSVSAPQLIRTNPQLAEYLGIDMDWFSSDEAIDVFAGNQILPGSEPIATVYAGHQFGGWNPQLGDGRAILLGEVVAQDGQRFDIQLKGAGQTPYSRMGDGLSPIGPVLREYIVSEAMAALGIPTTRSLAAVTTGDKVVREHLLPGAILTRVAKSHIRVGHFQYFSARDDLEAVKKLADHIIGRDFPTANDSNNPYFELLKQTIKRQAELIARWQLVGFVHGVMNTDNLLIAGETIDYGPCAFIDEYNTDACFSSIDHGGRYAYKNQPVIARWNLAWFAQSLLPFLSDDEKQGVAMAQEQLTAFMDHFQSAFTDGLLAKLGLDKQSEEGVAFANEWLLAMEREKLDFTLCFRHLSDICCTGVSPQPPVHYRMPDSFAPLIEQWRGLLPKDEAALAAVQTHMHSVNPAYIPRNHLVEAAINAAQAEGDLVPFHRLVDVLSDPFNYHPNNDDLTPPPQPHERVTKTFCGT